MKTCTKCKIQQQTTNFNKDKSRKDGLTPWCKACVAENSKKYSEANKDKISQQQREWYLDNREWVLLRNKEWREANPERMRELNASWYQDNMDRKAENTRRWAENNKDKRQDGFRRRNQQKRALLFGVESTLTKSEWEDILVLNQHRCFYCGAPWEHQDHFIPLSKGGTHTADNVVPACGPCNLSKSDKDPIVFLEQIRGTHV